MTDNKIMTLKGYPCECVDIQVDAVTSSVNPSVQSRTLVKVLGGFVYDETNGVWMNLQVRPLATDQTKAQVVGTLTNNRRYQVWFYGTEVKR